MKFDLPTGAPAPVRRRERHRSRDRERHRDRRPRRVHRRAPGHAAALGSRHRDGDAFPAEAPEPRDRWRRAGSSIGCGGAGCAARPGGPRSISRPVCPNATRRACATSSPSCSRLHDTMTQRAEAAAVADAYVALSDDGRRNFLLHARARLLDRSARGRRRDRRRCGRRPTGAPPNGGCATRSVPPADRLLRLLSGLEGGVKFLVDLRADVLRVASGDAELADLDRELKAQLATLFDVGLLELRRITWDAPAALLEKLIAYEAVHAIDSWDDLKNRLDSDRRCYAFFHPAMPNEPLVFVEIALTVGIATELQPLLDARAPDARARAGRHRGVLFDLELPARARGRQPRHRAHQASRRGAAPRPAAAAPVRDAVADPRVPAVARARARRPTARRLRDRERELLPAEPARVLARLSRHRSGTSTRRSGPRCSALCARYLTTAPEGPRRRPGRELPPRERRVGRARQLDGRLVADRPGPLVRRHGELPLRARPHPGARRGVRDRAARCRCRPRSASSIAS